MTLTEVIKRLKEIETPETTNMEVKVIKTSKLMDIEEIYVDEEVLIQVDKKK